MARRFTAGIYPVMARQAIARIHAGMVKPRIGPIHGLVTDIALFNGAYVFRVFACRGNAVMATGAHAQGVGVIDHPHGLPRNGGMARLTGVGGGHMRTRLTRCSNSIVAASAGTQNLIVIGLLRHQTPRAS